jgi:dephospho-CoA kinase
MKVPRQQVKFRASLLRSWRFAHLDRFERLPELLHEGVEASALEDFSQEIASRGQVLFGEIQRQFNQIHRSIVIDVSDF